MEEEKKKIAGVIVELALLKHVELMGRRSFVKVCWAYELTEIGVRPNKSKEMEQKLTRRARARPTVSSFCLSITTSLFCVAKSEMR